MIIGICGLAHSGKSTVAGTLTGSFGYSRLAFADPLKQALMLMGFDRDQVYGDRKTEVIAGLGVTPRHVMQRFGTDFGRQMVSESIWVDLWTKQAQGMDAAGVNIVADDVRFPNEVAAIKALGGQVWKIVRPGTARMDHASENDDLPHDALILNDGSMADLSWVTAGLLSDAR